YAAANDLSMVIGTQLRQSQFLPFIRYRLIYVHSQTTLDLYLDLQGPNPRPGAVLQTNGGTGLPSQDFSFEDAGGGFVYMRCHLRTLCVTAQVTDAGLGGGELSPDGSLSGGERGSAGTAGGSPPPADAPPPGVIQDIKYYHPHHGFGLPALQKW